MEVQKIKIEGVNDLPLMNGSNYFRVDFKGENLPMQGKTSQCCKNKKDWEKLWQVCGQKPPFDLPDGAMALCHVNSWKGAVCRTSLLSASKTKNIPDHLYLDWKASTTPMKDSPLCYGSFTFLILPEKYGCAQGTAHETLPATNDPDIEEKKLTGFKEGLNRKLPVRGTIKLG
jgi:hypothetical protein